MSQITHEFSAIDAELDSMTATNQQLAMVREELDSELQHWASYWTGDAHEAATTWSRAVTAALDHTIMASTNYVQKARVANGDMRAQEAANTSLWG